MALKKRAKAPKYPQGQVGRVGHAKSSMRKPKAKGIDPSNPQYGITGASKSVEQLASRANSLFGTSKATPTGQGRLESKAKRQVY